ncbi:hypothetical protein [Flavilitoribacter nigricans]|uniref:Outer membrane protein beta-barrel domain-containing protein n=1 Tax=Flavilitoribacter nigricans (strain ATCC 23147 / DSM 23189 / NBRC 102662 / NCIMB 1420 / SS-2) TaxID=1122177 RepID=A0A2D0N295_FLAN2|nr:hypothetical protein [Flavilitoribacter nigricans]PHN02249.1 hypothetical protein CRP01_32635 [Flavilitoribacter nigricans DSM 23189 = NBRC 102662]
MTTQRIFTILLFLFLGNLSLQAQYYNSDHQWWVNFGAGMSKAGMDQEHLLFYASFNKPRSEHLLLTGRYSFTQQLGLLESVEPEKNWDLSAIASYYLKSDAGFISIGAGLGLNGGKRRDPSLQNYLTVGLPIESQWFVTLPSMGLGLVGVVNINPKVTTYGLALAFQFGALR